MIMYVEVCHSIKDSFEAVWLLARSPVPFYGYSIQAEIQVAVTLVMTFPFTSSPANQGSALMSVSVGQKGC